jgi:hypothetical protein
MEPMSSGKLALVNIRSMSPDGPARDTAKLSSSIWKRVISPAG